MFIYTTKYEQKTYSLISQTLKIYEKGDHNYSNLAQTNSILHASVAHGTVPDYGTQYEENTFSHHGGMARTDVLTDWTLSYIPRFHIGRAGNNSVLMLIYLIIMYTFKFSHSKLIASKSTVT